MCRVAGAWEAGLFRDVLIFGFTLLRGILHWRRVDHSPCVDCFVIDGFIYFCLIAAVDVANILMYYFGDVRTVVNHWSTTNPWEAPLGCLSAVLIARLMLNMREVVDTGVYGTDIGAIADVIRVVYEIGTKIDDYAKEDILRQLRSYLASVTYRRFDERLLGVAQL
ncbi:hypothetical protein B0H14DRAFT_2596041 [Mycena olivaceomarginata]|nr:hypothetical protein B0H14DRAFT_2596041 [Mycena olivaceomarginata]